MFGVFVGSGVPTRLGGFEAWVPRPVRRVVDFTAQGSWADIENPGHIANWGSARELSLSVALIPAGASLATCATGAYNFHYTALGNRLVAWGHGDAILRPGWEFNNTSWFPWRTGDTAAGNANYAECFRQFVTTMRLVSLSFRFDWCMINRSLDPGPAYPGDAYVDIIGNDAYDQSWAPNWTDPAARWNDIKNGSFGIQWQLNFAAAHNKPVSFPEWGLFIRPDGHGGGDTPSYITRMAEVFSASNVAYQAYFEFNAPDGQHDLQSGLFPNGAAEYRRLFGQ